MVLDKGRAFTSNSYLYLPQYIYICIHIVRRFNSDQAFAKQIVCIFCGNNSSGPQTCSLRQENLSQQIPLTALQHPKMCIARCSEECLMALGVVAKCPLLACCKRAPPFEVAVAWAKYVLCPSTLHYVWHTHDLVPWETRAQRHFGPPPELCRQHFLSWIVWIN